MKSPSVVAGSDSGRRRMLYATVGGLAACVGVAASWWTRQPDTEGTAAPMAIWEMRFDTPAGPALAMRRFAGKPLLLNFWATWCPPCVDELPLLNAFFMQNNGNGWQIVGLAVDQLSAVQGFLQRMPLQFPVAMAGMQGIELSRSLGNISGALPFTLVLGSNGVVLHRKMGRVSAEDLSAWRTLR